MIKRIILLCFILVFTRQNLAEASLTIDMQQVSLQDALNILAKQLHQNIIISTDIPNKSVSVHLRDISHEEVFNLLLSTHHLTKYKIDHTWYIVPRAVLVKRQQDEFNLQTALDETAPLFTRVWQIHYAKSEDLIKVIQDNHYSLLSKRGSLRADQRTNCICAKDTVSHLAEIHQLITRLDIPIQQVLIETRLVTVDYDHEHELGINFGIKEWSYNASRYSLAVAKLADGSLLDVQLSALETEGHAQLISSPRLLTGNQQTASIEAGEEIPYQEVSSSGGTAIAFKKAVLSLKVTPQIMPNHKILLQLKINQDKPSKRVVLGVPAINTRQINTNVLIENGQTVVLGGIFEFNEENADHGLPILGKIPLIGLLFKQHNFTQTKRELLIFVTPRVC